MNEISVKSVENPPDLVFEFGRHKFRKTHQGEVKYWKDGQWVGLYADGYPKVSELTTMLLDLLWEQAQSTF